ncbi:uncharacterized protein A4U43_C05F28000 [Asparagus officinalis]|uniref:Uncharacterized protein n=1 Tax=Asparagus officinalis TaxID=4686 RepID=A0A5P1EV12_ASPOF|nr:uncharacterized protein LOC109840728 [Asparagus officinalis]ONK69898.1 uncharacterized protein A4U43_C05F28000 [Asparagus officinalis]
MCREKGGGVCGYDVHSGEFLCLCEQGGNVTTYCGDKSLQHRTPATVIAGTTTVVSVAGLASAGVLVWYLRKMRPNKVVTCGVQTTENRLF